jgi:outer membrane immunogenic protein
MLRKAFVTVALVAATASAASAADLGGSIKDGYASERVYHPFSWTGFYVGVHGGYGWGKAHGTLGYDDPAFPGVTAADIFPAITGSADVEGAIVGGQIGYNWQAGKTVFGIELDGSWTDITGSKSVTTTDTFTTWNIDTEVQALAALRGRLGFLLSPTFLLYGTGGFALGSIETSNAVSCVGCPIDPWATGSEKKTHLGWTVGGGAEWAMGGGWSLKAEYQYIDLGSEKHTFVGTAHSGLVPVGGGLFDYRSDSVDHDLTLHVAKVGLNYRF